MVVRGVMEVGMEFIVIFAAAAIVTTLFFLLFVLLFLVRKLGNKKLWKLALRLMRPVLRELYSNDLAEAANKVLQSQPTNIQMLPLGSAGWKDPVKGEKLLNDIAQLGFARAGAYGVDIMPKLKLQFLVNSSTGEAAYVMEHPLLGIWMDFVAAYPGHAGVTVSSGRDPKLPARMRRAENTIEYIAGAAPSVLYERLKILRRAEKPVRLTADNIVRHFQTEWEVSADWRSQHEFTPEEVLAMKKGRDMPLEAVARSKVFDWLGGGLAIGNFFALVFFLFASRNYDPVGNGPWAEALRWCAVPALLLGVCFAASMQASGPITRATACALMSMAIVTTKPGALGHEWIAALEFREGK